MQHIYHITGITCENCAEKVSNKLKEIPAITIVQVNLHEKTVNVIMNSHVELNQLNNKLGELEGNYKLTQETPPKHNKVKELLPVLLIISSLVVATIIIQTYLGRFSLRLSMRIYMACFFVTFAGFKLLDLKGFADAYQTYDLIAARSRVYAFLYPFIELGLGLAYAFNLQPLATNITTFAVMSISTIGVINALKQKKQFQCACLGTKLKLPMTKVTLFEDISMAIMAVIMLVI